MTLTQMRYFSAVCETLSFTKASSLLHVTQPAVSSAIRELEQECGVLLFRRHKNTLQLTQEGAVLLESIRPLLLQYDQLMHTVGDLHLERQFVRVGFATLTSSAVFSQLLTAFRGAYPHITVEAQECSNRDLVQLLESDQLDVILAARQEALEEPSLYHRRVVDHNRQLFCVSADHPLAGASYLSYEEIAPLPLILGTARFYEQSQRFLRSMEQRGLKPNVIHYTDQMYTVERFIESGAACGILPQAVARKNPLLVGIPYGEDAPPGETVAYWKRSQYRPQAVELFVRLIMDRAKAL